jgi:hypothetical protein
MVLIAQATAQGLMTKAASPMIVSEHALMGANLPSAQADIQRRQDVDNLLHLTFVAPWTTPLAQGLAAARTWCYQAVHMRSKEGPAQPGDAHHGSPPAGP